MNRWLLFGIVDTLLQHVGGILRREFRDSAEALVDPQTLPVVTITDSAGAFVSTPPVAKLSTGIYEANLLPTVTTAVLDTYRAEWDADNLGTHFQMFEVVGRHVFTLAELRAFDSVLGVTADYPAANVRAAREYAEERIEGLLGYAVRRRGDRSRVDGRGTAMVVTPKLPPRTIVSVTVDGTPFTAGEIADLVPFAWGGVLRQTGVFARGDGNVVMFYEYGLDEAPEPIRRAALVIAREYLVRSAAPDRATSVTTDEGTVTFAVAGRDGQPTGLPEVDAIVAQYARRIPEFA